MRYLYIAFFLFVSSSIYSQNPGDTIVVDALNFEDGTRDFTVNFPDDPNLTFEKIILKYTMRCKDGLVSTVSDRNKGCGEWDYSCNTFLVDSSKVEISPRQVTSHTITNHSELLFPYRSNPVYDYYREVEKKVVVTSTISENDILTSSESTSTNEVLNTEHLSGKSHFLYTAEELLSNGLSAGEIAGLSMNVLENAGSANHLKIKLKNTSASDLSGTIEIAGLEEVYNKSSIFTSNSANRFQFHTPFNWDGTSNILVEFNFTNLGNQSGHSDIAGEAIAGHSLLSREGSELLLGGNGYIECNDYKGIGGSQNRTVEAWIKGDVVRNGEICSWGTNSTGEKWTFRLLSTGEIRVEIAGTGTVSTTKVNDGKWHHVVAVLDGDNASDISFYIDGVLDSNSAIGNAPINTNNIDGINLRINRGVNNRYFDGEIDDVRIWDTNLSGETIKSWMRRTVDEDHPNYSNLQMHYTFDGEGKEITDASSHGRNAMIIGNEYRTSFANGDGLFKDFVSTQIRPSLTFYQGDYEQNIIETEVDRPFSKALKTFVSTNTITPLSDDFAIDDIISSSDPVQYWVPIEYVYDPISGDVIEERQLTPDGTIEISMLDYNRRFPFYNELVSFVTPYGIGVDFGLDGASWYFDMTDYVHILKGNKRLLMTMGGQNQEQMDLDFLFIVGTPPRDVVQYEQLWQGAARIGQASISDIINDVKLAPVNVNPSSDAEVFKLRSAITGHGAEGEFAQNGGNIFHRISVDGNQVYQWDVNQVCSENPIYPQGGTWVYSRQGWCPGEPTYIKENSLTEIVTPGTEFTIDYSASNPAGSGDYRYIIAHQMVGYGAANHTLDASVVEVLAPNNSAEYTRIGTICANPQVRIQNTGSTELTSLTINYWLNNAFKPQTHEWTGSLGFMETEIVTIPSPKELWMDVLDENNKFHVKVSNPNQGTDEYVHNNRFSTDIEIPSVLPSSFFLFIRTNNFPSQNSYQIFNADGDVVGSNDLESANNTYADVYDLEDGCYRMVFEDTGGDGLAWWANTSQGIGSAYISDLDGFPIQNFEADCGAGFEYSFTTSFAVSQDEIDFLSSIKAFPNPTQDYVRLEANDLKGSEVFITSLTGQRVVAKITEKTSDSIQFDVRNLHSGIYFITIVKGDLKTTRRFVKQ